MKSTVAVVVLVMAVSLAWGATGDNFDLEIVKAGTGDQHEIELGMLDGSVELEVLLSAGPDVAEAFQGVSLGVQLEADQGVTAAITALRMGRHLETAKWGDPPDFQALDWFAPGDLVTPRGSCVFEEAPCTDIVAGAYSLSITTTILLLHTPLMPSEDFICVEFTVAASGSAKDEVRAVFSDVVGSPPMATVAVAFGLSYVPAIQTPATITLTEPIQFLRGDANADGRINIADPMWNFQELFYDGPATPCPDAADTDDDGTRTIGDSIYLLYYLFRSGPQPPLPFPGCGVDDTSDELGCVVYEGCR